MKRYNDAKKSLLATQLDGLREEDCHSKEFGFCGKNFDNQNCPYFRNLDFILTRFLDFKEVEYSIEKFTLFL